MPNSSHRVVTTDAQIDAALARAREFAAFDVRAVRARYSPADDRVVLTLSNGVEFGIPRTYLQGLQNGTRAQLSKPRITDRGTAIRWPQLGVEHYVPGLLHLIFGTRKWMAEIGRRGGASTSAAKTAAARANGAKGGRPAKTRSRSARERRLARAS